jgi:phosphoglycolate phosphatase-like HAD superfamily hydrolase
MSEKPIVCVDLDGVLNDFDGWKSPEYLHPPRPGAREFLARLNEEGYEVVVFTVRWGPWVEEWLAQHGLRPYVSRVTKEKCPAHVYIDDRAICFRGNYPETLEQVLNFRAHWEHPAPEP